MQIIQVAQCLEVMKGQCVSKDSISQRSSLIVNNQGLCGKGKAIQIDLYHENLKTRLKTVSQVSEIKQWKWSSGPESHVRTRVVRPGGSPASVSVLLWPCRPTLQVFYFQKHVQRLIETKYQIKKTLTNIDLQKWDLYIVYEYPNGIIIPKTCKI